MAAAASTTTTKLITIVTLQLRCLCWDAACCCSLLEIITELRRHVRRWKRFPRARMMIKPLLAKVISLIRNGLESDFLVLKANLPSESGGRSFVWYFAWKVTVINCKEIIERKFSVEKPPLLTIRLNIKKMMFSITFPERKKNATIWPPEFVCKTHF